MLGALVAAALVFAPADAHLARETANGLVARYTPRDGGTEEGRWAAVFIRDQAVESGLKASLDRFEAETETGRRTFANVEGVWQGDSPDAPWVVFISHFDTKPGVSCPGANDGASTTGLLVALGRCVAESLGLKDRVLDREYNVRDDHQAFLNVGFRALDLIDFDYGSAPGLNDWWHTEKDTMDKVSEKSLLTAGRLCLAVLGQFRKE